MINRLGDSLDFQSQALTLRSERQRLLASNIANADTPGYVARDMDFATALREAAHENGIALVALGTDPAGTWFAELAGSDVPLELPELPPSRHGELMLFTLDLLVEALDAVLLGDFA